MEQYSSDFSMSGASFGSFYSSSHEESSWTAYLDDFIESEKKNTEDHDIQNRSRCESFSSSSMVSDAASCAAWKLMAGVSSPRKLRKVRRNLLNEDPLEDTASSPVNSPKISELSNLNTMSPMNKDEMRNINSQEKSTSAIGHGISVGGRKETMDSMQGFNENTDECTDLKLKRKGLCLVPLSMLVEFLG